MVGDFMALVTSNGIFMDTGRNAALFPLQKYILWEIPCIFEQQIKLSRCFKFCLEVKFAELLFYSKTHKKDFQILL